MADEQDDFHQMWVDAQNRFKEMTKKSLVQSRNLSLDDALRELDQRSDAHDTEQNTKRQRFKNVASNVLKFIQLLGGIAAQGASVVFAPASLCFDAMQSLMNIPAKISSFHDDLVRLFEEISIFMKQFRIYKKIEQFAKVDVELRSCTHKLLIIFVHMCAISIDVLSGSRFQRLKMDTKKALFDNDSGESDAVTLEHVLKSEQDHTNSLKLVFDTLEKASEDSRRSLEATQAIDDKLSNVKLGTDNLVKYADDSKSQKVHQEQFEYICDKLSVTSDAIRKLEKDFHNFSNVILSHTGAWLEDVDTYKRYTKLDPESDSRLLLIGNAGSGKSSLAFNILNNLGQQYGNASPTPMRVSMADYRFMKLEKLARDDPLRTSLKYMAAQIANQTSSTQNTFIRIVKSKMRRISRKQASKNSLKS